MPYKPMPPQKYRQYISLVGWRLEKGSIDWILFDENNQMQCAIKISHGRKTKQEIDARSVKKTENFFNKRGWQWPPKKK